jgi:hypothetical protein
LALVYLLPISGLIAWEYRDHLIQNPNACAGVDAEPKSTLYSALYARMLDWTHNDVSTPVSVVAIPADLEEIQANYCLGREYLADVLTAIATQHPAEIVIDKFYSPASCASAPASTQKLAHAIQSTGVPVIIGENTGLASQKRNGSCLVAKPRVDFAASNARYGDLRLDVDVERIPFQWKVLPADSDNAEPETRDTLSLAAIKAYDNNFTQRARIQTLIDDHVRPYARLDTELPRQTSTDVLCAVGTPAMRQRWSPDCSRPAPRLSLLGRIVVIGSEQGADRRIIMGVPMWGFDTQARYIAAMLSGSYLHALPSWMLLPLFALFVIIIEGLPTLFEVYRPHWKAHPLLTHAFTRRRYVWVIFWTLAFILVLTAVCILLHYLPPLALFGDICLVVITRLLFFLAESVESPLIHHQTKGHPHV